MVQPFWFFCCGVSSCGLVILYRSRLIFNRSWVELNGRFLMAEFSDRGLLYRIVCIYALNRNPERDTFFTSVADLVDLAVPTVLCGDFNAVFNGALDRRGVATGSLYRDSSSALSILFRTCCVVDTWRYLHPDGISFSWMRPDGAHASRINFSVAVQSLGSQMSLLVTFSSVHIQTTLLFIQSWSFHLVPLGVLVAGD